MTDPTPQHLLISFQNGTIGHMNGPVGPNKPLEKFEEEILQRCDAIGLEGTLVDAATYKVVGVVSFNGREYSYTRGEPEAKPRSPRMGR